jgi:GNAT superfamily N-acetyltransferase
MIYPGNKQYLTTNHCKDNLHCDWSVEYLYGDFAKYWDENNLWDRFPIQFLADNNEIVGAIGYTYEKNVLHIKRFFCVIHQRGKGYGRQLLEHAWEQGYNNGCNIIRMWCDRDAIPFYSNLGFNYLGVNSYEYAYVYTPILSKSMPETLNKTKHLNPFQVLKENNIPVPEEAKIFCL